MGGWSALPCDDRSERLDRRLGDGEIIAVGLSLGAWGYVLVVWFDDDLC